MERKYSFFCCLVFAWCISGIAVGRMTSPAIASPVGTTDFLKQKAIAGGEDTTGKKFRPQDPFPAEKEFKITSEDTAHQLLDFRKNDVIRISTSNGLKHYRNKRLLNTYKIIPQLAVITIQPQCRVAPCPPVDTKVLGYYMGAAERFIIIRNNALLISADIQKDADSPTTALRLAWKRAYGLTSR